MLFYNKIKDNLSLSIIVLFTATLFSLTFYSCSTNKFIASTAANFFEDGIDVIYREGDLKLAEDYLSSNLKNIEILLSKDPQNKDLNLLASKAFGAYTMAFVEEDNPNRATKLYKRALKYGLRSLPKNKNFTTSIKNDSLKNVLKKYNSNEIGPLFWVGYNWGRIIFQNFDRPENLVNLSKVRLIMDRCKELDEEYNFSSVNLFFGIFWSARPRTLGGNPEKAKKYFKRCINLNENKLYLAKYYYARYYATQVQNEKLFDNLLSQIISFDLEKHPDYKFMNALAKEKAKRLKKEKDKYF